MTVNLSDFPLEKYNDHMYEGQASEYKGCTSQIDRELKKISVELGKVDKMLGIDPEKSKDLLTYNVIVGNTEIKDEIDSLCSNLGNFSDVLVKKGSEIDLKNARYRQETAIAKEEAKLNQEV